MKQKKVLLLCYYFPPNTGVGGRRWVKFCKFLSQQNIDFTVVTPKKFKLKNQPSWQSDVATIQNLKVIEVNDGYPKILLDSPSSFISKIVYRFAKFYVSVFTKGNKYDPSSFWKSTIDGEVNRILEEQKINNLIVSGIPFNFFYYAALLKSRNKAINLVLDFRDLWTDSMSSYGRNVKLYQSQKRFEEECRMERFSVLHADHILCASNDLLQIYQEKYPDQKDKFKLVINGYDPDEMLPRSPLKIEKKENSTISVVNVGTINCSRDYYMNFIEGLSKIKENDPELYGILRFDFYGNTNATFETDLTSACSEVAFFYEKISSKDVHRVIQKADMVLYIKKEDELPNSFASKFYEYLSAGKFMIVLSPEGMVTEYIRNNNIGVILAKESIYANLKDIFFKFSSGNLSYNQQLNISEFGYDQLSEKIGVLLQ